MKNSYRAIIVLIIVIIIMALPYFNNEMSQEEVWLLSNADNSFRLEFHSLVLQFSDILSYVSIAESPEDIAYIKGRIDSFYLTAHPQILRLSSHTNIDQKRVDKIIDSSLQVPVFELISNMRELLAKVHEKVEGEEAVSKLNEIRGELNFIYQLSKELYLDNSNKFTDKDEIEIQKLLIDEINNKIKKVSF